jgi:predicted Holliday junction resolvase-like endonuclease
MSAFVESFQELRQLFGICPCCGQVFRLSEAQLFVDAPPPKTPWDKVDDALARLEAAEARFEEKEAELREAATEKGRKAAARRLRRILPFLAARKAHPQDVKVLFSPVRYVAFPGMHEGEPRAVHFFDVEPTSTAQEALQKSLAHCIKAGNYEWATLIVRPDGTVGVEA